MNSPCAGPDTVRPARTSCRVPHACWTFHPPAILRTAVGFTLLLLSAAPGVPGQSGAQAREESARRPTIVLPPQIVAGQPATLAVLDATGRPAPNATVIFGGGEKITTDATGRAPFTAPENQGVLHASLPEDAGSASATVIAVSAEKPSDLRIAAVQRILLLKDRLTIRGCCFSGEADSNSILLGGQPAAILAASPVALVALPNPGTPLGESQLQLESGHRTVTTAPITVVSFGVSTTKPKGLPGEEGEIRVGVLGTEAPVEIEIRARPEERIELTGGNPARRHTKGGADNSVALPFRFRQPGEFFFEVRLVPQPLGLLDVEAARKELFEARSLAPPEWVERVDRLLQLLERHPQDVVQARDTLEKMLAAKPPWDFDRHLEAAWRILLNRE
jgi:hypothetical protein